VPLALFMEDNFISRPSKAFAIWPMNKDDEKEEE
jgi:hypothetical protein